MWIQESHRNLPNQGLWKFSGVLHQQQPQLLALLCSSLSSYFFPELTAYSTHCFVHLFSAYSFCYVKLSFTSGFNIHQDLHCPSASLPLSLHIFASFVFPSLVFPKAKACNWLSLSLSTELCIGWVCIWSCFHDKNYGQPYINNNLGLHPSGGQFPMKQPWSW